MKNFSRLALVNVIALSVLGNSTLSYAGQIKNSKSASVVKTASESAIVNSIKNLKKDIETKNLPIEVAAATFTDSLIAAQITVDDLNSFVKKSASAKDYAAFRNMVDLAKQAAPAGELSSQEFGMIASEALKGIDSRGLAWSGCAGLTSGVILAIGAVVVGIVALVKTSGEERVRNRYANDRASSQKTYDTAVIFHTNRSLNIEREFGTLDAKMRQNDVDMAYYQGLMVNENDQDVRVSYSNKINALKDANIKLQGQRAALKVEQDNYQSPGYVQMKIAQAKLNFDTDTRESYAAEERAVERIPADQALAKKLGIGAGVGAALGTYFIIDGSRDC